MERIPTERTAWTPTEPTATTPTARTPEPDARLRGLAGLIGAGEVDTFLRAHFGKAAWRTRIAPERARGLFGWSQLNAALAEHRLAPPRLRLERAGGDVTKGVFRERRTKRGAVLQDLDPAALNARLREGATLILDAANEASPPLQAICASLAAEFACSCQANLYACWGTTQGFDVHWDDHDVFVVQIEGRKRWALYGVTRSWPTRKDHHGEHPRPETPVEDLVLEPGDILYLPRGYWHAAVGLGGPTLHLTVGLTRKTGSDFLHWLADHALADAAARADLPLEQDDAVLGAHLSTLLARVAEADPAELARLYRRHVQAAQVHRPELSFPFIGEPAEDVAPDSRFTLAEGPAGIGPGATGDSFVLTWRGVEFTLGAGVEAVMRQLAAGRSLTYGEIEAAASEAARPLLGAFLAEMVGRGVLVRSPGRRA